MQRGQDLTIDIGQCLLEVNRNEDDHIEVELEDSREERTAMPLISISSYFSQVILNGSNRIQ